MNGRRRHHRDPSDPDEPFSVAEEVANSLTHGAGLLLGVAALVLMVFFGVLDHAAIFLLIGSICHFFAVILYVIP